VEILDAEITEDFGILPTPVAYYDGDLPNHTDMEFEGSVDEGLWYGEHEETGVVSFFAWDGGEQDGYGGRHYEIETVDGEEVTLKGPWSSRAGVMNNAGYGPCMKTIFRDHPEQLGGRTGAMTVEAAEEMLDEHLDYEIEMDSRLKFDNDEEYFFPRKVGGEL